MTIAGIMRDEFDDLVRRNDGDFDLILAMHTELVIRTMVWCGPRTQTQMTMESVSSKPKRHSTTVKIDHVLRIKAMGRDITVSHRDINGCWIHAPSGSVYVTVKLADRLKKKWRSEFEGSVIVTASALLINALELLIQGDPKYIDCLLKGAAEGLSRDAYKDEAKEGYETLGFDDNRFEEDAYYRDACDEMLDGDLENRLFNAITKDKGHYRSTETIQVVKGMVKKLGAEKCEELLTGDARTLWHAYCDVHAQMNEDRENDKEGWANYVDKLSTMLMPSNYDRDDWKHNRSTGYSRCGKYY